MSLNGRRDGFTLEDLIDFGAHCGFKRRKALGLVADIAERVRDWPTYADAAGVHEPDAARIGKALRYELAP